MHATDKRCLCFCGLSCGREIDVAEQPGGTLFFVALLMLPLMGERRSADYEEASENSQSGQRSHKYPSVVLLQIFVLASGVFIAPV